mgnify:CR=1 FL=1
MNWFLYVIIAVLIVLFVISNLSEKSKDKEKIDGKLPYKKRDDFLSKAEKMFYDTLNTYYADKITVCPKVAVKEIVFVGKGTGKEYMKYFNWIAKKHVDFVLCNSLTMDVLCAVELDDSSHAKADRQKRDAFIDKVFEVSQIPLIHIPLKSGYSKLDLVEIENIICEQPSRIQESIQNDTTKQSAETLNSAAPICPKCGVEMVRRKAAHGDRSGKEFYGCPNYPKCKEIKNID